MNDTKIFERKEEEEEDDDCMERKKEITECRAASLRALSVAIANQRFATRTFAAYGFGHNPYSNQTKVQTAMAESYWVSKDICALLINEAVRVCDDECSCCENLITKSQKAMFCQRCLSVSHEQCATLVSGQKACFFCEKQFDK